MRIWPALVLLASACGEPVAVGALDATGVAADSLQGEDAIADVSTVKDGADAETGDAADVPQTVDATKETADASPTLLPASTHLLTLQHGAFPPTPAHPSALVYVPAHFDPTPPLAVVIYLHGWNNCVVNVAADQDQPCTPGGPVRPASHLVAQFEAAHKNALLLIPEVAFDQSTSDCGMLAKPASLPPLLTEVLEQLAPVLGQKTLADVGRVVVATHSGGYVPAAALVSVGGVPVQEVWLLDSLYGKQAQFGAWIQADLPGLASGQRRFFDVYTNTGGTLSNSQALAKEVAAWLPKGATTLVDDPSTATWAPALYDHGLLFKHSALSHHGVTLYYPQQLIGHDAHLAPRP